MLVVGESLDYYPLW